MAALADDRVAGGSRSQISVAKLLVALCINAIGMKLASQTSNVRSVPHFLDIGLTRCDLPQRRSIAVVSRHPNGGSKTRDHNSACSQNHHGVDPAVTSMVDQKPLFVYCFLSECPHVLTTSSLLGGR